MNVVPSIVAAPSVTNVNPASGSPVGGDSVVITGTGFRGATRASFGPEETPFTVESDTRITATTPAGTGEVDVIVTTPAGTSATSSSDRFTYREPQWRVRHSVFLTAFVILIGLACWLLPSRLGSTQAGTARTWSWLITFILLFAFMVVAGQGITYRWAGLLIDERNKISLSRLQLVVWTTVIVSAILAAAIANVVFGQAALAIGLPIQIWAVMGISTTSLVGSPLILNQKAGQDLTVDQQATADRTTTAVATQEHIPPGNVSTNGLVVTKADPCYARWVDLFKGEEAGNGAHLDMAKIQMFFFTLFLAFAYAVNLVHVLASADLGISEFPPFDDSMVALLGISHAGYLTSKAVPHS